MKENTIVHESIGLAALLTILLISGCLFSGCSGKIASDIYSPVFFHFSGGTGKVNISCDKVKVEDGRAEALLCFDSEYYTQVRVGEAVSKKLPESDSENSCFWVPVTLDEDNTIYATTTRMSQPHEIEYVVFVSIKENPSLSAAQMGKSGSSEQMGKSGSSAQIVAAAQFSFDPASIKSPKYLSTDQTLYASCFRLHRYEGGCTVVDIAGEEPWLVVPEGALPVIDAPDEVQVIHRPIKNIYLAASAVMSLVHALDGDSAVSLTGIRSDSWTLDYMKSAIDEGRILYAGSYRAPDYEMLLACGCGLAVESTMIYHTPQVREKLEDLGIPVFVDHSSYEEHPLGRTEWIKVYGVLLDQESRAEAVMADSVSKVNQLVSTSDHPSSATNHDSSTADHPSSAKIVKIAFFTVNTDGTATVRSVNDYVTSMIRMAGGVYVFDQVTSGGSASNSTVKLSDESFYRAVSDADVCIYYATISDRVESIDELIARMPILSNVQAIKKGNVWLCDSAFYQSTDRIGEMITDFCQIIDGFDGKEPTELSFLDKLE